MAAEQDIYLSVVIPVYKAEFIVDELLRRLRGELSRITDKYEIILVEDCGPDNAWDKIVENCAADFRVKGLRLSRNFGQHHAITAGLDIAKGEWIVVMDCDLQDQPEEIPNLYNAALSGYDIVFASREYRKDGFFKRLSSRIFFKVFSYLSGIPQDGTIANFGIYNRKVIQSINTMREPMRAFSPMVKWVGFNKTSILVEHASRFEGKSSYSWSRLIKLAFDIAVGYSDKPLKIIIRLGLLISFLSVCFSIYSLIEHFRGNITISGYASIIVSIWFLSGLIIFTLGIIGLYISRIFEGIKDRPIYIIQENINTD